jgi:hypothetical protein
VESIPEMQWAFICFETGLLQPLILFISLKRGLGEKSISLLSVTGSNANKTANKSDIFIIIY